MGSRSIFSLGLCFSCLLFCLDLVTAKEQVTFQLGNLGNITGITTKTIEYPNVAESKTYYKFRNIPYAEPVVRFRQSKIRNSSRLAADGESYDATKDGPICIQGSMSPDSIDSLMNSTMKEVMVSLIPDLAGMADALVDTLIYVLISVMEIIMDITPGIVAADKTLGAILYEWLDITIHMQEDCLQLSVDTPWKPDGSASPSLPIMFFVHGGAFYAGTHIRMGAERLGSFEDVVVVAINYRIGPLGFMCLDTDEAAGNMGMLDIVVALEWVHQYAEYFGGDPNRITIFGESAGSATITHLLLSEVTNGLFVRGIGQSGSALAAWSFDNQPEYHARQIGLELGCAEPDDDRLVECMRGHSAADISSAYASYRTQARKEGELGFGGSIPCAQTKGERKFYKENETPTDILFNGGYGTVPVMFGANSHEGSYVYGVVYNSFLVPNNLTEDEDFLRYELVPQLLKTVGVSNPYALEEIIKKEYFDEWQIGNLVDMEAGIVDLLGAFFIKASSYEIIRENSRYSPSYWYAFNYRTEFKSVFHLLFLDPAQKANTTNIGTSHADELMYLFDVELPVLLCDLGEILTDMDDCLALGAYEQIINCIVNENMPFRNKWRDCLTGQLTEEEREISAVMTQLWTSFAVDGVPTGPGIQQFPEWTQRDQQYVSIDKDITIRSDYTKEYHVALESTRTTPNPTTASSTASNTASSTLTSSSNGNTTTPALSSTPTSGSEALGSFVSLLIVLTVNLGCRIYNY